MDEEAALTEQAATTSESYHETIARHKREERDLEGKLRALVKCAKGAQKKIVETQVIQMQFDLRARHNDELDRFYEEGNVPDDITVARVNEVEEEDSSLKEQKAVESKKAKAQRKKDKKVQQSQEREATKEAIKASSGPSLRDMELQEINRVLSKESFRVKEMLSDGNCLYRAIADQMNLSEFLWPADMGGGKKGSSVTFIEVRYHTAAFLREHATEFAPFVGVDPDSHEFLEYCGRVESPIASEWGGQVELRAIASCLECPIYVYDSTTPLLVMGEEFEASSKKPLRVTFHRHYFSLGEHYNSVEPMEADECCR